MKLLLIVADEANAKHWHNTLSQEGWHVDHHLMMGALSSKECAEYDVIIMESVAEGSAEITAFLEKNSESSSATLLPILRNPTPDAVVCLIRLGVVDVLLPPFSDHELIETVNRVAGHKSLYEENLTYSAQLEKTNRELQESLNILKMDHLAGRQVQKNLLPKSPLICRDYTVAHRIIPSLYLSGDFVGYNVVLDRFLIFYLADVSGHGASSAFVTILLRFLLRRIVRRHTNDNDLVALARAPEGFMEHVNRQMIATGLEKHLTMFAGAIDLETNILRYSVASQMPMPVFAMGNDARFLPGKGKPIGFFEGATWQVNEIVLPESFSLVMMSDGLFEITEGESIDEKETKLLSLIAESAPGHDDLCQKLGLNSISSAVDDVSLLSIVRKGKM